MSPPGARIWYSVHVTPPPLYSTPLLYLTRIACIFKSLKDFCIVTCPLFWSYAKDRSLLTFYFSPFFGISKLMVYLALSLGHMKQKENPVNSPECYTLEFEISS